MYILGPRCAKYIDFSMSDLIFPLHPLCLLMSWWWSSVGVTELNASLSHCKTVLFRQIADQFQALPPCKGGSLALRLSPFRFLSQVVSDCVAKLTWLKGVRKGTPHPTCCHWTCSGVASLVCTGLRASCWHSLGT